MADFDNLLEGALEEETQPSLSINDIASQRETASLQDDVHDDTHDLDDNHDDDDGDDEAENTVPPALQEALRRQRNDIMDQEDDENSREKSVRDLDLYGETQQVAHATAEYDLLKKLWIQELNTTELCYYDEELVDYLIGLLDENEDAPDHLREEGRAADADPTLANIAASICNMDMERLRFILVDLFRIRLEKIEKYALHNRDCRDRMCTREVEYLKSYGELFQTHLERTVTDHFPNSLWKRLDEPDMIPRPDLDTFVFCKVIDEEGIVLNDFEGMSFSQDENGQHKEAGETLFVRYQTIRDYVQQNKVELLM